MKADNINYRELGYLILAAIDGKITPDQMRQLKEQLSREPAARKYYLEYIQVHIGLYKHCKNYLSQPNFQTSQAKKQKILQFDVLEELAGYERKAQTVHVNRIKEKEQKKLSKEECETLINSFLEEEKALSEEQAKVKHQQQLRLRMKEMRRRQRMLTFKRAALKTWQYTKISAVAAMLAVIAYMVYLFIQPVPVATLTGMNEAEWDNPDRSITYNSSLLPGPLKLTKGYAEITFDDGSVIILEAPAWITLESENKAFLGLGKLTAKVATYSQGFTINTPTASIIDLGTEFGVEVQKNGTSDLHTFKGQVALSTGDSGDRDRKSQIVEAGFAKRVVASSKKIIDITFNEKAFAKTTRPVFEEVVTKSSVTDINIEPVVHFSFDGPLTAQKEIIGTGGSESVGLKPVDLVLGDGEDNYALSLETSDSFVKFESPFIPGPGQVSTMTMWLWYEAHGDLKEEFIILESATKKNKRQSTLYILREQLVLDNWTKEGRYWVIQTEPKIKLQPRRWSHIAVTYDQNKVLRIYINGEEAAKYINTNNDSVPWYEQYYFGTIAESVSESSKKKTLMIDDFAFYERVLSEKEIMDIVRSAKYLSDDL
ncbi:MAG: LamG-like jellyroll fold domain-containing protein [Planctomycetota bacterium]|jgi:hypothetical protein